MIKLKFGKIQRQEMSPQREHRAAEWSGGGDLKLPEEREWGPEGQRRAHTEEHHLHHRRSVQMSAHPQRPHRQVLPLMQKLAKETWRRKPEECGGDVKQPLGTMEYELSGKVMRRRGALGCSPVAPTTISRKCLYDAPESNCSTGR